MSASIPGHRDLPASQYNLDAYWGRVCQSAQIADPRTLFVSSTGLEHAKSLIASYKQGEIKQMTPELWHAKQIVDSTLHPDTGEPVFLPLRMSCFVLSNLVVTGGMLTPGMGNVGTVTWQIINQSLNVGINTANSNKSTPLTNRQLVQSYLLAVSASCSVALGLNAVVPRLKRLSPSTRLILTRLVPFAAVASAGVLNVFLMRGEEIRRGIDVYPAVGTRSEGTAKDQVATDDVSLDTNSRSSLGRSRIAARLAVSETALSRVLNATPIMVIPPLVLVRLQRAAWLAQHPRLVLPVNLGLILTTSLFALPLALGVFPQRQQIHADKLEPEFHGKGGPGGLVEFNRGI